MFPTLITFINLQYHFVTPLTSLVVVKPNETKSVETEKAHAEDNRFGNKFGMAGAVFAAPLAGLPPPPLFAPMYPAGPAFAQSFAGSPGVAAGFGGGFGSASVAGLGGFAPAMSVAESDSFDLLPAPIQPNPIMGGPLTTRVYFTTTFRPFTTTTVRATSELPKVPSLLDKLPWLRALLSVNDTDLMTLDGSSYHIGGKDTIVEETPCKLDVLNKEGNCTLIDNCPALHSKLTDVAEYKNYFCSLESNK